MPDQDIERPSPNISTEDLEGFIDGLMAAPGISMMPQDQLVSRTLVWSVADLDALEALTKQIPLGVVRAKGIVKAGKEVYLLNCVMDNAELEKIEPTEGMAALLNKVVFIGPPDVMAQLDSLYKDSRQ